MTIKVILWFQLFLHKEHVLAITMLQCFFYQSRRQRSLGRAVKRSNVLFYERCIAYCIKGCIAYHVLQFIECDTSFCIVLGTYISPYVAHHIVVCTFHVLRCSI